MPDLHVVAIMTAKPGSESAVRDVLSALVEPTRREDGCLSYELYDSLADPSAFITVETWRSQDDLDAHLASPHIREALAAAGDHLASAPGIHPLSPVG